MIFEIKNKILKQALSILRDTRFREFSMRTLGFPFVYTGKAVKEALLKR